MLELMQANQGARARLERNPQDIPIWLPQNNLANSFCFFNIFLHYLDNFFWFI